MSFTIEKHPTENIIIARLHKEYSTFKDTPHSNAEVVKLLDQATQKQNLIIVYGEYVPDFSEVHVGSNSVAQGEDPLFKHENLGLAILVSDLPVVKMMAAGMASDAFGNLNVLVFDTEAEALAHCRQLVN